MCELFAMSSRAPATVSFSHSVLAEHGGKTAVHKDGWGIAYYEDGDIRLLRDTTCASNSPWVRFVDRQAMRSTLVLSHIRKATEGAVAIRNTQPFSRELGGRMHVFIHNGHLPEIRGYRPFQLGSYQPIGDTDSEYAFCVLLERLKPLWRSCGEMPDLTARLTRICEFASELGKIGLANFVYCDSEVLFAHGHRRKQPDGAFKAPGLHLLHRQCARTDSYADTAGVSITSPGQKVVLVASVPLTAEAWEPLVEGEVIAIANGEVAARELTGERILPR
jgi:glutamine amidotransferase